MNIEAGPAFLSGEFSEGGLLLISDRVTPKWELSLAYVSEQHCHCAGVNELMENIGITGARLGQYKSLEFGIGASFWQNENRAFGEKFNVHALLGWNVSKKFAVRYRHWSNAGSGRPNLGQDALSLAWFFK